LVKLGKEQPFERGVSGSKSYLDHEATTSIGGGSSQDDIMHTVSLYNSMSKLTQEEQEEALKRIGL
jgi:hypothetical protein